jgi:hypothetical protein
MIHVDCGMCTITEREAVGAKANTQHVADRCIGALKVKRCREEPVGSEKGGVSSDIDVGANVTLVSRSRMMKASRVHSG